MNEAWEKHIQPIINSPGFEHSNWIWDPFLKKYPEFGKKQRIQVEDTLLFYSFDSSDEDLTIKSLGIAGILQDSKIASKRFSSKMKDGLRKYARNIHINQPLLRYYVFAFASFDVKEAIPSIKSIVQPLKEGAPENPFYLDERRYQELFRACCISLLKLRDNEAKSLFTFFILNDARMMAVSPDRAMWGFTDLASFWKYIGVSGFKEIVAVFQTWQKEYVAIILPNLKQKTDHMRYQSDKEKQEVFRLVEGLEHYIAEA